MSLGIRACSIFPGDINTPILDLRPNPPPAGEAALMATNNPPLLEVKNLSVEYRQKGQRVGRNPKTGEPVNIPAKRVPYFKAGKELKELINENQ